LTKISVRLDHAITTTDLPGALAGRLDGITTAGTVTVDRILTSHHKLSGSYSFLHSHPLNPQIAGSAANVNLLNLGYTWDINPGLVVRLAGGTVKSAETSFIGAAAVEKQLGNLWVAAGYQRYLSFFGGLAPLSIAPPAAVPFADGVTPNTVYQVASVRAWGQLSRRWKLEGSAQRAINGTDPRFHSLRSLIGQMRVTYQATDRVAWFAVAEHYGQTANAFLDIPLSRNRFFAGVEVRISRPPEQENARNKHGKLPQDSQELKPVPPEEK
jgi:hypothetical protein